MKKHSRRLLFGLVASAPLAVASGAKAKAVPAAAPVSEWSPIASAREFGMAVCKALGIDPHKTGSIDIAIKGGEFPTVLIEQCVTERDANAFATILKRYKLVASDE